MPPLLYVAVVDILYVVVVDVASCPVIVVIAVPSTAALFVFVVVISCHCNFCD